MFRTTSQFLIDPAASTVRSQIPDAGGKIVAAQPNLLPHLPHDNRVVALGRDAADDRRYDIVLVTQIGDMWPLSREEIAIRIEHYQSDAEFVSIAAGPLFAFRRRTASR